MSDKQYPADNSPLLHDYLRHRWSPRSFNPKAVEKDKLRRIFEAARWAPSSGNEQPWRFLVGIKGEGHTWQKVYDCLDAGNRKWTKNVPVLGFAIASKRFAKNSKFNRHFAYDTGQAVAHLTFQAAHEGLVVHQMGGFYPQKAKAAFNIPDGYDVMAAFAVGYLGTEAQLAPGATERSQEHRTRKPIEESVFTGDWEQAFLF
jgi:nitroreductase